MVLGNSGYTKCLNAVWASFDSALRAPFKSALTKIRNRISFLFFKEQFDSLLIAFEPLRKTWRGLRIYATDGDQLALPASEDVLGAGYRGYPCKDQMETHFPRMYVVQCHDILSGVTRDFRYSHENQEVQLALEIATQLEPNSVTLYDRLFFCRDLGVAHDSSNSYFFARCRSGETVLAEIRDFEQSNSRKRQVVINGVEITLLKIKNPTTNDESIFATNLPKKFLSSSRIKELYTLRWGVETANRDFTATLAIETWHSNSINGVLQEIYAGLWALNQAKIQISNAIPKKGVLSPEHREYVATNFKSLIEFLNEDLLSYAARPTKKLMSKLAMLIRRTSEKRHRLRRTAPRVVKSEGSRFPSCSLTKRRS